MENDRSLVAFICLVLSCLPHSIVSSVLPAYLNDSSEHDWEGGLGRELAWNMVLNRQMQTRDVNWENWKMQFSKRYPNSQAELRSYLLWSRNYQEVVAHNERFNRGEEFYTKSLNSFCDMSPDDVRSSITKEIPLFHDKRVVQGVELPKTHKKVPSVWDWRRTLPSLQKHPVRVQGRHPHGWMFAATESIQSNLYIQLGKRFTLSVQELLDCMEEFGYQLESMVDAFLYIGTRGISFERNYPFTQVKSKECMERTHTVTMGVTDVFRATPGDEKYMKRMIGTMGPLAAYIHVSYNFMTYSSGVFWDTSCLYSSPPNHAVLVMGYGSDPVGGDYWLIKNSWGPFWGEDGFMRLSRNSLFNCAITSVALYPVIAY